MLRALRVEGLIGKRKVWRMKDIDEIDAVAHDSITRQLDAQS